MATLRSFDFYGAGAAVSRPGATTFGVLAKVLPAWRCVRPTDHACSPVCPIFRRFWSGVEHAVRANAEPAGAIGAGAVIGNRLRVGSVC